MNDENWKAKLANWFMDFLVALGPILIPVILVAHVLIVFGVSSPLTSLETDSVTIELLGQFGDSFGVITSAFTALAAWIALFLLRQNRRDMFEARRIMKEQKRVDIAQVNIERFRLQPDLEMDCRVRSSKPMLPSNSWLDREMNAKVNNLCSPRSEVEYVVFTLQSKQRGGLNAANFRLFIQSEKTFESKDLSTRALEIYSGMEVVYFLMPLEQIRFNSGPAKAVSGFLVYTDATELTVMRPFLFNPSKNEDKITFGVPQMFIHGEDDLGLDRYEDCERLNQNFGKIEGLEKLDQS